MDGYTALCDDEVLVSWGMLDNQLRPWMAVEGWITIMIQQDPDRYARVLAQGVGLMRIMPQWLFDLGFTEPAEVVTLRPVGEDYFDGLD